MGRFERGELLPDALLELCKQADIRAAQIRGQGILSQVDLGLYDLDKREYASAFASEGAFELVSFLGIVSMMGGRRVINAHLVVAFSAHGQHHLAAGQLRNARAHAVEFVVDVFEDVELQCSLDTETQLPLFLAVATPEEPAAKPQPAPSPPRPEPPPRRPEAPARPPATRPPQRPEPVPSAPLARHEPERPGPPSASESEWRAAARRSQSLLAEQPDDDEALGGDDEAEIEEIELQPGDLLLHPRLGECTVVRVDEDEAAYIRIHKSRRISKLALSLVRLEPAEDRAEERVFRVRAGDM